MRKKEPDADIIIDHVCMEISCYVFFSIYYFTTRGITLPRCVIAAAL